MNKDNTVKNNYEFEEIIKHGKSIKSSYYVIYYKNNLCKKSRFGISVGKKIGKAFFRNKIKRQIRNIINKNKNNYQKSIDYIIIVRKACAELQFTEKEEKFQELILKI